MRFEFKYEDVKLAIEANLDELAALGKGVVELAENDISIQDIMNMVMSGRVPDSFNPEKNNPVKAEDLLDEEKGAAIQKLKDLGCSVKKEEEDVYECKTNSIWEDKYTLVKVWLKDHGIKYEERLNSCGREVMYYDLCMTDLENMIDWLDDHGDKIDTTIEI